MKKQILILTLSIVAVCQGTVELELQYQEHCSQPSDIFEHLPRLRELASTCSSVTEIGVRELVSTWGILQGLSESGEKNRTYLGIDLNYPELNSLFKADQLAEANGVSFTFWQANDLYIDIPPTDMLFIDSWHTYCHLTYELEKFSPKVSKYIALHDTSEPWGDMDEPFYQGVIPEYPAHIDREKRGLWAAVEDFLDDHPEWILNERRLNNHGFTILERKGAISPPRNIPDQLLEDFTLDFQVPVYDWYIDGTTGDHPIVFKRDEIAAFFKKAKERQLGYYGATDQYLFAMLDKYEPYIKGKKIAIIGSITPWYETIVLTYGGSPTTIEYNPIQSEDPRFQVMTVQEFELSPQKFDSIISISSIEHDGLGRYGDPINPRGDIEAMNKMKNMLNEEGLLFLAIPVGQDSIYWNAHRVYGPLRLPLLFRGWEVQDSYGFSNKDLQVEGYTGHQPVFVLKSAPLKFP